jgi:hydrogenase maturation protein HypF
MTKLSGSRIHITGVVQGVGFRPFVYGLALRYGLAGWVRNTSAGVDIEVDGSPEALASFAQSLRAEAPALARIDSLEVSERTPNGFSRFEIVHSAPVAGAFQPISPDVSLCDDCRRELFDPADRRYRYPFINCTNCGPRFTIIQDIPYDRPQTTMASFPLCDACAAEYHDPLDRRFHAQPVACADCGPRVWMEGDRGSGIGDQQTEPLSTIGNSQFAIQRARFLLRSGTILAVKGLGGFHLACDATSETAVSELRRRKLRVDKPFAVMMADIEAVERHCQVSDDERALLLSRERPIVILRRRPGSTIAAAVAPNQTTTGVMLPYTPLHELLLEQATGFPEALVMTSGNIAEEPIAYTNEEARARLAPLADAFLLHNRDIHVRCDDSVVRDQGSGIGDRQTGPRFPIPEPYFLRRSRGYAPGSLSLPWPVPPLLAAGAELKNTFCLARDQYAFLSHHIGDLENYETLRSFEEGIEHFQRLFHIAPQAIAYDLHPDYLATRYALERAAREGLATIGVQHHHAHIAACMAEHGLAGDEKVIGVSFDGTGYGVDGETGAVSIWGGEFLVADYAGYARAAHLADIPLPGGDKAVKEPWRLALAWLQAADIGWDAALPPVAHGASVAPYALDALAHQLGTGLNSPPTSSMGRLFDAVAALAGVRQTVNYEAQAAIELEALVDPAETGAYPFRLLHNMVDPLPVIAAVADDARTGTPLPAIAARFHNGVANMVAAVCRQLRDHTGLNAVALSGGVWQNMTLLHATVPLLAADGFTVYTHRRVPTNDGGLALGQALVAAWQLKR